MDQLLSILCRAAFVIGGGWVAMSGTIAICIAVNRGRQSYLAPMLLRGAAAAFLWLVLCLWYFS
ncbi:hypothetical protein [Paenirhodobacter populi]|uniref:Uncharacterized protein n=1 Tax=Paenirhodobacter populi TaxID=2306993 RepID=A0A443JKG4_9RHOB|nr:hypothetical protein [Sinirhodobacter populi]RWR21157.1 hypothetical protein D2T30_09960 [Sinirhodobacter populi]